MSEEIEISEEERSVSENSPRDVNDSTYIYDSSSSHEDSNQSVCESDNESSLDSILENDAQNLDDLEYLTENSISIITTIALPICILTPPPLHFRNGLQMDAHIWVELQKIHRVPRKIAQLLAKLLVRQI
ncbi:hypothetical protein ACJJTC_004710 [Scirpophaga incertulas]